MRALVLNLELSRRIEIAEARAAVEAAETLARLRPDAGAATEEIAGGYAVYAGADSPVTQAVGMGLAGAVGEEEFQTLEAFYASRHEPVRVEASPLMDSSLLEKFGSRGYRVTEFTNVLALPPGAPVGRPVARDGVSVHRVGPEERELWTGVVCRGFSDGQPVPPEYLEIMSIFAFAPSAECYLARVDGQVAGGGTLAIRDGVAGLFGASTLPEFRRRGVQRALLDARLERARESGSDLAVCLARPGSTSERNVTRQGFLTLYTRVKFEKHAGW